ncbi:MAG TPA: hypothetical protein VGF38_21145 [Ktedonobacterales bacterium]
MPAPGGGASTTRDERRRIGVPGPRRRFQGVNDVLGGLRMLASQRAAHQDAAQGFGHIEPTARERGGEDHYPLGEQPEQQRRGVMTSQVVPDQEQPQAGELGRQGDAHPQRRLPARPTGSVGHRIGDRLGVRQLG